MTSAQVQAASDTDHLLRLAIRVGSIGIFQSDLERQQTSFSPELCTTLGLPVGTTMPYDKAMQLFDQRDRGAVLDKAEAQGHAHRWFGPLGVCSWAANLLWPGTSAFPWCGRRHHRPQGN
jgi:hypothetical protein